MGIILVMAQAIPLWAQAMPLGVASPDENQDVVAGDESAPQPFQDQMQQLVREAAEKRAYMDMVQACADCKAAFAAGEDCTLPSHVTPGFCQSHVPIGAVMHSVSGSLPKTRGQDAGVKKLHHKPLPTGGRGPFQVAPEELNNPPLPSQVNTYITEVDHKRLRLLPGLHQNPLVKSPPLYAEGPKKTFQEWGEGEPKALLKAQRKARKT